MRIYQYDYTGGAHAEDGPMYRMACSIENNIPWLDALRDYGWDAASPLFPRQWKWTGFDDIASAGPLADFPPSVGIREVLSPHAFGILKNSFGATSIQCFSIRVEGEPYWYVHSPLLIRNKLGSSEDSVRSEIVAVLKKCASQGNCFPPFFRLFVGFGKRYHGFCTESFKQMVERNALTGLEFELFCEV